MSNAFFNRCQTDRCGRCAALMVVLLHVIVTLVAMYTAVLSLDVGAVARGQLWRLVTAPLAAQSILGLLIAIPIFLWTVPGIIRSIGVGATVVMGLGFVVGGGCTTMLALVATGQNTIEYPIPPLVVLALMNHIFTSQGQIEIRRLRIPVKVLSAIVAVVIAVGVFVATLDEPPVLFSIVSLWLLALSVALLVTALAHHRTLLEQFRSFERSSAMMIGNVESVEMINRAAGTRSKWLPPQCRDESEYVDLLLEKIFRHGELSLTEEERAFLRDYSQRI
ncbi:MAG: hypothetical protein N2663_06275 [Chlorobi bacterium]|nr:hypothetical protein [Chlorobiota bacterium]